MAAYDFSTDPPIANTRSSLIIESRQNQLIVCLLVCIVGPVFKPLLLWGSGFHVQDEALGFVVSLPIGLLSTVRSLRLALI